MQSEIQNITDITIEELEKEWKNFCSNINREEQRRKILSTIQMLKARIETFEKETKYIKQNDSVLSIENRLNRKKDLIYTVFFRLQNLINAYENQRISITYVHKTDSGQREIRLYNNTISNLAIQEGVSRKGSKFKKLGYEMDAHYKLLKNSLPEETNQDLQKTAIEVEKRYIEAKQIVYWQIIGRKWAGYKFINKGPINEAFVNFYVNTRPGVNYFAKDNEHNVATYVMHQRYGARAADTLNGFLVGDVSKNGIQYAVKGEFGSPQGYRAVYKALKDLSINTSYEELSEALTRFRDTMSKIARPLIRKATEEKLNDIINQLQIKI